MRKKRSTFKGSKREKYTNARWRSRASRHKRGESIWPAAKRTRRATAWTGARSDG